MSISGYFRHYNHNRGFQKYHKWCDNRNRGFLKTHNRFITNTHIQSNLFFFVFDKSNCINNLSLVLHSNVILFGYKTREIEDKLSLKINLLITFTIGKYLFQTYLFAKIVMLHPTLPSVIIYHKRMCLSELYPTFVMIR